MRSATRGAVAHLDPVHRELLGPVPETEDVRHAPAGDVIEHRHVFGETDRVVEREERGGDHDVHLFGAGGDRRRKHER